MFICCLFSGRPFNTTLYTHYTVHYITAHTLYLLHYYINININIILFFSFCLQILFLRTLFWKTMSIMTQSICLLQFEIKEAKKHLVATIFEM